MSLKSREEKLSTGLKLIAKSSIIVFIGLFISKLFLYLYRIIIARVYGVEVYGLFSLALIILNFLIAFSTLGLNEGLVRYISIFRGKGQYNKIRYLIKVASIILFIFGISSTILLFLIADIISKEIFHNVNLTIYLKISSIIIPFYILSSIYLSVIRAFEKIEWYSFIVNILQNVMKVLFLALFVFLGLSSDKIMYSFFVAVLVMFFFSYYLCKYKIAVAFGKYSLNIREREKYKKELFSYSIPLMFSSVFAVVYYWLDSFVVGYFKGVTDVGLYNAAVPIALLIAAVPDLFIQLFYPLVTKEYAKGDKFLVKEISKQVAKWIVILTLPLAILVVVFPGAIINILFEKEFLLATFALRILALSSFIAILSGFLTTLLLIAGKSKMVFFNLVITSIINLILNIILVRRYGFNGAAIATASVWILLTLILFIEARQTMGFIPLRKKMLRILFVSILPLVLLITLKKFIIINFLTLVLLGIFFFLSYFILIFITRCFDENDMVILRSLKRKLFQ